MAVGVALNLFGRPATIGQGGDDIGGVSSNLDRRWRLLRGLPTGGKRERGGSGK
jgi:hypothetical protein